VVETVAARVPRPPQVQEALAALGGIALKIPGSVGLIKGIERGNVLKFV